MTSGLQFGAGALPSLNKGFGECAKADCGGLR
ncbi:MAG: hypothetical protein JWR80_1342 [Bradyrhizobium sp.]|nr:hypothetical protein [Bradyrhizobium sp.]